MDFNLEDYKKKKMRKIDGYLTNFGLTWLPLCHEIVEGSIVISPANKVYTRDLWNQDVLMFGKAYYYLTYKNDPKAWRIEVTFKDNKKKFLTIKEAQELDRKRLAYWSNLHRLPSKYEIVWGWTASMAECPLPPPTSSGDITMARAQMKLSLIHI